MSRTGKAFFSYLIAGVIFLTMLFFILPWLLLILAVVGIAALASVLLGRGSINITTIRITNSPHVNLAQDIKTVLPMAEHEMDRDETLQERIPDIDITINPDGSISGAVPKENSFETTKDK